MPHASQDFEGIVWYELFVITFSASRCMERFCVEVLPAQSSHLFCFMYVS